MRDREMKGELKREKECKRLRLLVVEESKEKRIYISSFRYIVKHLGASVCKSDIVTTCM